VSTMSSIALIGPAGAGKSTQGRLLARALGRPSVSLDAICFGYYAQLPEVGLVQAEVEAELGSDGQGHHERQRFVGECWRRLFRRLGKARAARFKELMEIHALRRALEEHEGSVIDFGAGHSVFSCEDLRADARRLLAPLPFVVLLMPSPDVETSVEILCRNLAHRDPAVPVERIRYHVTHPSNRELATHTVFTGERTPEEVCEQLLCALRIRT
jgi:hypothetical protein